MDRNAKFFVAIVFGLCLPLVYGQTAQEQNLFIDTNVSIEMRDGTTLSAIVVYDKSIEQPQPTAFQFTIYVYDWDLNVAKYAARRGYASVLVYSRGVKVDGVEIVPYEHDAEDAYDVLDWITRQPWSDGRVGMYGGSYSGLAQWSVARLNHPALTTIVPQVSTAPGINEPYENNVFSTQLAYNWTSINALYKTLPKDFNNNWFQSGEAYKSLDKFSGHKNKIFSKWINHPHFDEYWKSITTNGEEFKNINIPVLTTTGYYDDAQSGAMYYYKEHLKNNPNADHYLVIGPYDHLGGFVNASEVLRGYKIDDVANESMSDLVFEWFDHIFKGRKMPDLIKDRVNYQVMGSNKWAHAPSLDQLSNRVSRFYLSTEKEDKYFKLAKNKPDGSRFHSLEIDFTDRTSENNLFTPLIINKATIVSNGIVFETEKFKEDLELNGALTGEIAITINKKDVDISFALYQAMPDGSYFFLNRYITRASYSHDRSERELLTPGKKYIVPITNAKITSRKLSKGSRLILVINGNKNAYEQINYGTGGDVSEESVAEAGEPLVIHWHADSYINVPLNVPPNVQK